MTTNTQAKAKNDSLSWFRLYPGIVTTDLIGMPLTHAGAYLRLLCLYWHGNMELPEDEVTLYRKTTAHTEEERQAVREVIQEYFPIGPNGRHTNQRLDEHLALITETSEKQRQRANARWKQQPQTEQPKSTGDSGRDF